jgi:hypothetical protein
VVNAGAVFVLKGSRAGLRPAYRLRQSSRAIPARAEPGDHFGFSLAAGDFGRGRSDDLAVGVPDEDDDRRHENTGAVNVIYGSRAGLGTQKGQVALTYAFHSGARWGFSLAAADFGHGTPQDELAVGGPFSRLGPLYAEAGIVWVLIGGPRGLNVDPIANIALYHPGAYGPALGVTEAGDHFGYALAPRTLAGTACRPCHRRPRRRQGQYRIGGRPLQHLRDQGGARSALEARARRRGGQAAHR